MRKQTDQNRDQMLEVGVLCRQTHPIQEYRESGTFAVTCGVSYHQEGKRRVKDCLLALPPSFFRSRFSLRFSNNRTGVKSAEMRKWIKIHITESRSVATVKSCRRKIDFHLSVEDLLIFDLLFCTPGPSSARCLQLLYDSTMMASQIGGGKAKLGANVIFYSF